MSRSELTNFRACPKRWLLGHGEKDTPATEFGTLVDCLALQPDSFDHDFIVHPSTYQDGKTGEAKKWTMTVNYCKDWKKSNAAGKQVVSPDDYEAADKAIERLLEDKETQELLDESTPQVLVMGEYNDPETGIVVPVKGLIDMVPPIKHPLFGKALADLKTARDAHPEKWERVVWDRGYHVQGSLYLDLYTAATGEDRVSFLHLIVENEPPFEPGRRVLSSEFLDLGRMKYMGALRDYCQCLKENHWPGYERAAKCLPTLPGWQLTQPRPFMMQYAE